MSMMTGRDYRGATKSRTDVMLQDMGSYNFPPLITLADYRLLHPDSVRWLEPVRALCEELGYRPEELKPVLAGSNLVCALGAHEFIKIFPPFLRHQYESERRALPHLFGRLSVPSPKLLHQGKLRTWGYIVLTRVDGVSLETIWPTLAHADKISLLRQVGSLMREVQSFELGTLADLEPKWQDFLAKQKINCLDRHQRFGLPEKFQSQIELYLEKHFSGLSSLPIPVILTGECTPENILVVQREGAWHISGLIDFGDVMIGEGEYDLLGPCGFMVEGDPNRLRALFEGYGITQPDASLRHRLMTMLLLHRYSNFNAQIRIADWANRATSLDDLEKLVFPFGF